MFCKYSIVGLTIATSLFATIVYRLKFHSLAKVPGPRLNVISWHTHKGKSHEFLPALHERYGRAVRIAHDKVLVRSEEAARVGGVGSPFVQNFWYQGAAHTASKSEGENMFDLFIEMNKDRYRLQRRAIGPAYSMFAMEKHKNLVEGAVEDLIARVETGGILR
ncbi:hypothetical protein BS50DRAFT_628806 [Corynespora cassiicola Philippines]|uniref:Cytochrome P450 n=1 Tax=Corynespora cassiicola Philippines TaxID=1448308 RepID=A0A2T2PDB5_CORCC|nr:hypothetical protein BS50DRAFT_628806 [Corynespora cassiicola Philippines]